MGECYVIGRCWVLIFKSRPFGKSHFERATVQISKSRVDGTNEHTSLVCNGFDGFGHASERIDTYAATWALIFKSLNLGQTKFVPTTHMHHFSAVELSVLKFNERTLCR